MTRTEYEACLRHINGVVYKVYFLSCVAAVLVCPLTIWVVQQHTSKPATAFGYALLVAIPLIGVPLFLVLRWASEQAATLHSNYAEEVRSTTFLNAQKYLHKHKEAISDDEQDTEELRPDDSEHG